LRSVAEPSGYERKEGAVKAPLGDSAANSLQIRRRNVGRGEWI